MIDQRLFLDASEKLEWYGGSIFFEDEELVFNGTQVDCARLEETWDGGTKIAIYAGSPEDEESDFEELELSEEEEEQVLETIVYDY